MTVSRQPQITEELLSAYLDDQVTAEERALVEAAIATDPAIAWQVDSLRQTVHLLQALPPLALPRTFSLEAILAEARAAESSLPQQTDAGKPNLAPPPTRRRTVVPTPAVEAPENHWWQWFLQLWQGGNLQLRNAAAVAFILFFVLFVGDRLLVSTRPMAEMTPRAAPVLQTNRESVAVEAPVTLVVEPTATMAAATIVVAAANNSEQPAGGAAENAGVNPLVNTAVDQPENLAFQAESATFAAPGGAPGPREEDLTGGSGPTGDALATTALRAAESDERGLMTKSTAPMMAGDAASAVMSQAYAVAAEPALTMAITEPVSETAITTDVMSVTVTVTPTATITPTVAVTSTVDQSASLTIATSTGDESAAWLIWVQMFTALSTLVLAGLWWRSRR